MEEEIKIDDDFILIRFQNNTNEITTFQRPVQLGLIQFHFGLKGNANYIFNQGNYSIKLNEEKALLFYNTEKELPLHVDIAPKSWLISIFVSIKKFNGLFNTDAKNIPFFNQVSFFKYVTSNTVPLKAHKSGMRKTFVFAICPGSCRWHDPTELTGV